MLSRGVLMVVRRRVLYSGCRCPRLILFDTLVPWRLFCCIASGELTRALVKRIRSGMSLEVCYVGPSVTAGG